MKLYYYHGCKKNCIIEVKNRLSIFKCKTIQEKEDWLKDKEEKKGKKLKQKTLF